MTPGGGGELVSETFRGRDDAAALAASANDAGAVPISTHSCSASSGLAYERTTVLLFTTASGRRIEVWYVDGDDDAYFYDCSTLDNGVTQVRYGLGSFVAALDEMSAPAPVLCINDDAPPGSDSEGDHACHGERRWKQPSHTP